MNGANASGLVFVLSHIDVEGTLPFEIGDGHFFRAANDSEIEAIQKRLDGMRVHEFQHGVMPYRSVVVEERHGGSIQYRYEALPREKWKYWVLAFNGMNDKLQDFQRTGLLLPTEIEFGMTLLFSEPHQQGDLFGWSGVPIHMLEKYTNPTEIFTNAKKINHADLLAWVNLHAAYRALPASADYVLRALQNFDSLRAIPPRIELRTLGYFSIIESLVTHAPRSAETLDSINHQIVNKLILLSKRFEQKISLGSHFLYASDEKIWKLLYGYRSCLAHGGVPDFNGSHQLLKSQANVFEFVHHVVKQLIIYGMRDHEFLSDLKSC